MINSVENEDGLVVVINDDEILSPGEVNSFPDGHTEAGALKQTFVSDKITVCMPPRFHSSDFLIATLF